MRECILVDVSNLMYKYLHVYSALSIKAKRTNGEGEKVSYNKPMGHIYGMTEFISGTIGENPNLEFILTFDGRSPRRNLSDTYKDRIEYNDNYSVGEDTSGRYNVHKDRELLIKLLSSLPNVFILYDDNLEADDLIYNYIRQYRDLYDKIYIISEDRDLLINVDDKVTQYKRYPKGANVNSINDDRRMDINGVRLEYFGLSGEYLTMYKSLVGDSSDNIKGFSRIPKKIAAYIARYAKIKDDRIVKNKYWSDEKTIDEELKDFIEEYNLKDNTVEKWIDTVKSDKEKLFENYSLIKPFIKDVTLYKSPYKIDDSRDIARKYMMKRYVAFLNEFEYELEKSK